mmetsp:Transcript_18408/g.27813  ORF Transcript_18408/g.27813 Transcript_18408/m.27813 type:complete len:200 (-) Transcript_18408:280-879(-)
MAPLVAMSGGVNPKSLLYILRYSSWSKFSKKRSLASERLSRRVGLSSVSNRRRKTSGFRSIASLRIPFPSHASFSKDSSKSVGMEILATCRIFINSFLTEVYSLLIYCWRCIPVEDTIELRRDCDGTSNSTVRRVALSTGFRFRPVISSRIKRNSTGNFVGHSTVFPSHVASRVSINEFIVWIASRFTFFDSGVICTSG